MTFGAVANPVLLKVVICMLLPLQVQKELGDSMMRMHDDIKMIIWSKMRILHLLKV